MTFNIEYVEGRVSVYKIWNVRKKSWWATPSGRDVWLTFSAAKNAIRAYIGKSYRDCSKRYKVIQCINIVFREIDAEGTPV